MNKQGGTFSDDQLLEGIRAGDHQVLKQVYDLYLPGVAYFVKTNSGSQADALDVFQDGLVVLYKKLLPGDFVLTSTLKTYLQAVCRRIWMNKRTKTKGVFKVEITEEETNTVLDTSTETLIEKEERESVFREYFFQLGKDCQQILSFAFSGIKMKEIAKKMGIASEGAARKKKFKCQQRLVDRIKKDSRYNELKFD